MRRVCSAHFSRPEHCALDPEGTVGLLNCKRLEPNSGPRTFALPIQPGLDTLLRSPSPVIDTPVYCQTLPTPFSLLPGTKPRSPLLSPPAVHFLQLACPNSTFPILIEHGVAHVTINTIFAPVLLHKTTRSESNTRRQRTSRKVKIPTPSPIVPDSLRMDSSKITHVLSAPNVFTVRIPHSFLTSVVVVLCSQSIPLHSTKIWPALRTLVF